MAMTYYGANYESWYHHQQRALPQSGYSSQHYNYRRPAWSQYGREYNRITSVQSRAAYVKFSGGAETMLK